MIWPCGPRAIAGHARDRYVYALLDGVLRDLTHDDVPVTVGTKVIEVDPRGRVGGVGGIACSSQPYRGDARCLRLASSTPWTKGK
jgi:hypothetical protein